MFNEDSFRLTIRNVNSNSVIGSLESLGSFRLTIRNVNKFLWTYLFAWYKVLD